MNAQVVPSANGLSLMDESSRTDAEWAQAQTEEEQRWEHFHRVNDEFRRWAIAHGYLPATTE